MGVQIKFESSNSVEGVGSTPGTSRIPLEDFYDVIAEYKKNPKKLEGILTKNANLSSEAKDFMRKFIQYSNKNKIFDGFSKDNPETSEDEFKNELINFVQEQKEREKMVTNTLNFNDTFSTKASKVSTKKERQCN